MKRFTLTMMGLLMLLGGVKVQAQVTPLELTIAYEGEAEVNDGMVQFKNNKINYSALGGTSWAASYESGQTHVFTVTLAANTNNTTTTLCLTATRSAVSKYGSSDVVKTETVSVSPTEDGTKQLVLSVEEDYAAVYLWQSAGEGNDWGKVKIASITREVTTASSVGKPTITAPATYDGESTAVTITPGANNHHVKYSVSDISGDVSNGQITSETTIYITGSSNVTITAVGYNEDESESNTNTKTITYSNVVPSGINTVWESSKEVSNNWAPGETFTISKSEFSELKIGDYIFIYAAPASNVEYIGFRNGWSEDGFSTKYTAALGATSGGDLGKGTMQSTDTYWWAKIIDSDMLDIFKKGEPRVQGKSYKEGNENKFTITKVEIRKHVNIGEGANTISKSTDMIVNLDRSFTPNTWNTVCLPFVPTADQANTLFGSGYQLAEYTSVSGTTMHFTPITIDKFVAGKPYLVMPKTGCATGTTVLFDVNITATANAILPAS